MVLLKFFDSRQEVGNPTLGGRSTWAPDSSAHEQTEKVANTWGVVPPLLRTRRLTRETLRYGWVARAPSGRSSASGCGHRTCLSMRDTVDARRPTNWIGAEFAWFVRTFSTCHLLCVRFESAGSIHTMARDASISSLIAIIAVQKRSISQRLALV